MKRGMKIALRGAGVALGAAAVLSGGALWLIATPSGLEALAAMAGWFVPVKVDAVKGDWRRLTVEGFAYEDAAAKVRLPTAEIEVDLDALWREKRLRVPKIRLAGLSLEAGESSADASTDGASAPPAESTPMAAPLPIRIESVEVEDARLALPSLKASFTKLSSGVSWKGEQVLLFPTTLTGLSVALEQTAAPAAPVEPPRLKRPDAGVDALAPFESPAEVLRGALQAPLVESLPEVLVPLELEAPEITLAGVCVSGLPESPWTPKGVLSDAQASTSFRAAEERVEIRHAALELPERFAAELSGSLEMRGAWPVTLSGTMRADAAAWMGSADPVMMEHSISLSGEAAGRITLHWQGSGWEDFALKAEAGLGEKGLPVQVNLEAPTLRWLVRAQAASGTSEAAAPVDPVKLTALKFTGSGPLLRSFWSFSADAEAPLANGRRLEGRIALDASITPEGSAIERAYVTTNAGELSASGRVDWSKALDAALSLKLAKMDLTAVFPKFPLKLQGGARAAFRWEPTGDWRLEVKETGFSGTIAGAPVGLELAGEGTSARVWSIPKANVLLGRNRAELKAELERFRKIDVSFHVDAPGLLHTIPGLKGAAKGDVRLTGNLAEPKVDLNLRATNLAWQDLFELKSFTARGEVKSVLNAEAAKAREAWEKSGKSSEALSADVAVMLASRAIAAGEAAGSLRFEAAGLKLPAGSWPEILLTLDGRESSHRLALAAEGKPVAAKFEVVGAFDRSTFDWKGTLSKAVFETPVGGIAEKGVMPIRWSAAERLARVGAHCWTREHAEVCLRDEAVVGRSGRAALDLKRFDLAAAKPFLKRRDKVEGTITGSAEAAWDLSKPGLPDVKVELRGDGISGETRWDGVRVPLKLSRLRIHARTGGETASASWEIEPEGEGRIEGVFSVVDPMKGRRIDGRARIARMTPSLLKPFFAEGEKAAGYMEADLRAGGTLRSPEVYGRFTLDEIDFDASYIPFEMEPSRLVVDFNGQNSTLEGRLRTTDGEVLVEGSADWTALDDWKAKVSVKADKLRLSLPPMIQADVEGDLSASADPTAIRLFGKASVPWARITVADIPKSGGVSVSEDEVILDENLQPKKAPTSPVSLFAGVDVHVGPDVRVDAFGLKAGIGGDVRVIQSDRGLGLNGEIRIPGGRFHAYGQDLIIQKGSIHFSGSATNPALRLEAIRNPDAIEDGVTAGIRVTGSAERPRVELFSDPAMSQEENLSYLVRGVGLSGEGGDSSAMTGMLIGLGASQGSQLLETIGDAVGIEGLSLDTTGVGDSSQVVVSGYILPGLQVKYGIGIFDSLATLTLRYRLMPRLYVEAASGVDQALDFLYRFSFE